MILGLRMKGNLEIHGITGNESDTYDLTSRTLKEQIQGDRVQTHWDIRAQRDGVQAVMSARHSVDQNIDATTKLQMDVLSFLEGYIEGKTVFELGVGIGRMTNCLSNVANYIDGCDFSPVMLEKARKNLASKTNVGLYLGKITDTTLPRDSYDLVFESIVLLHILDPLELKETANKMMSLSDRVFLVEHTYEGSNFPISKYSILREPGEYARLFSPYKLVKQKEHSCAGDKFTMMLFEK
jgi:SAM-dependent methyltransferase